MTRKRLVACSANSGYHAFTARWLTSSTEGVRRCLDMQTDRFVSEDGRILPGRPTKGESQGCHWIGGWAATGRDAGSQMRQMESQVWGSQSLQISAAEDLLVEIVGLGCDGAPRTW